MAFRERANRFSDRGKWNIREEMGSYLVVASKAIEGTQKVVVKNIWINNTIDTQGAMCICSASKKPKIQTQTPLDMSRLSWADFACVLMTRRHEKQVFTGSAMLNSPCSYLWHHWVRSVCKNVILHAYQQYNSICLLFIFCCLKVWSLCEKAC